MGSEPFKSRAISKRLVEDETPVTTNLKGILWTMLLVFGVKKEIPIITKVLRRAVFPRQPDYIFFGLKEN
jgi:hypothetical protein